jgi:hypothetical protein|tara:strand:+ start:131 stop:703 length:573 start_codon:yes stop_codon:yes gene_type:complete
MYNILYLPLSGGQFICQLLTAHLDKSKNGKDYFDPYDNDMYWIDREKEYFKQGSIVNGECTTNMVFSTVKNLSNIFFISVESARDEGFIKTRMNYIDTIQQELPSWWLMRLLYHKEMYKEMKEKNIPFFDFPAGNLTNKKLFLDSMNSFAKYINLEFDDDILSYAFEKWSKANLRALKTKLLLKNKEGTK